MNKIEIGYVGLGKMGLGMVGRMKEKGYRVVAFNRSPEPVAQAEALGAEGTHSLKEMVSKLAAPRTVWVMVTHTAVDAILADLLPLLSPGDTVIDGGNSPYMETVRRAPEIEAKKIHFIDAGVSGGPGGARNGACIMVGGKKEDVSRYESLFKDLVVPEGYAHVGPHGAGHFVKMVHNGIEYGMMQAIAEGFAVLKASPFGLDLGQVASLYNRGSVIESSLVRWLGSGLKRFGPELADVSGEVAHSGEGLWTVEAAKRYNVDVPVIERSLQFRVDSKGNPSYTGKALSAMRFEFGGHSIGGASDSGKKR